MTQALEIARHRTEDLRDRKEASMCLPITRNLTSCQDAQPEGEAERYLRRVC